MNNELTRETDILDLSHHRIKALIEGKGWRGLNDYDKIGAVYQFVKDDILFGYNRSDDIKASDVLDDGYGQCNTKASLLMALLRSLGITCRFHGFTIKQDLQKGAIPAYIFWLAPKTIIHSWVEVRLDGKWINLEGFILDESYLKQIQRKFSNITGNFCGYGVATTCLTNPGTDWQGKSTYIQKEGIHDDYGVFNSPDDFYRRHGTNLKGIKRWLYRYLMRHLINANVKRLRQR